ncbi:MAG: hypothetical protein PGN27_04225 [Mycolicibacterium neoaurum]|uniref:hypothetical protein n=1 Tax=Mycolicibacterium neoaurum TaxID=1795 RepID=UPI002FF636F1
MTIMTHPENDAVSWRDLADRLTETQVLELECFEKQAGDTSADAAQREWLIGEARDYITENAVIAELTARIQPPRGASAIFSWDSVDKASGLRYRVIQWAARELGYCSVDIDGYQDETGAVDGPHLSVYGLDGTQISTPDAVKLAETLIEAAAELERLKQAESAAVSGGLSLDGAEKSIPRQ